MLSENLEALRGALHKYAETGVTFEPAAIEKVCRALEDCAEDARRMEAVTAGSPRSLPPGVSDLAARRATAQMRSWPRGGGDAA